MSADRPDQQLSSISDHPRYRGSSSGGGGSGFEPRLAKLEAAVEYVEREVVALRTDMRDIRDRMTRLEERVSHLPSKGFIVSALVVSLGVAGALLTIVPRLLPTPAPIASPVR